MSLGKLYGAAENGRTIAVLVAAKSNDLDLELVRTEPNSTAAFNKSPEYTKINPSGKIPAFEDANGFVLSEVIALAIYVTSQNEKTTLLGKTKQDYASILRWLSYTNFEVLPHFGGWYRPLLGLDNYNKKAVDDASKTALKNVGVLETHLTANTYLVGDRVTLADFFAASLLTRAFATVLDKEWRGKNPAVTRWYNTIIDQPAFKAVHPNPVFAEEIIKYTPPKKEEKPKAAPAAAAAAAAAPAPAEAKPEKPKHPLAALPPAALNLEDWKRMYSNEDTRSVSLPWFWQNFNAEEWSLWRVDFKYNEELRMTFMAANQIGGFFNRLEASRKYMFGAAAVYGVNYECLIRGVMMVRGQEYAPAFEVGPDWESYAFTKLDASNEEDRKFVGDMWAWDVPVVENGKELPWVDGHEFK